MPTIAELLHELESESPTTRQALERIPEDRLEWRPHPKSMSLGELAMHIASLPAGITGIATWPSFDVATNPHRPEVRDTGTLLAAFDESLGRARAALAAMDDSALDTPWKLVRGEQEIMTITRGQLLRTILFNHWYHHRGQLTVYLRQLEVPVPAIYGPSADEVPF